MALRRTENSSGLLDLDNGLGGGYILSKICLSITLAVLGANIGLAQVVLREDFAALTLGDNTTISNQATVWTGDALFTTVVRAYQAGGAVKLGSFSAGSITSKALDLSGGAFDVSFDVKGWETVEGGITVTATGQTAQTVTYTSVMSGSFETKVVHFSAGTAATTITLATTARRAFLDNIIVTRVSSSVAPTVTISTGSYTYNGSYQGPGASDVNKGGSTGALTLQYGGSSMVGVQYGPTTIPPTGAGNYTLVATVAQDANYSQGVASANFTINKASATVNVSGTDQIYDGTPKQVAVITSPENLPVTIMYSGSSAAPTLAGDYSVMVTVTSPNYSGAASGRVLKIAKGTPLLSGITATSIAAGQALSTSTISGTAKNAAGTDVVGNWTFQNSSSTPSAGTNGQGVNFTPSDSTNYNTATGSVSVTVVLDPAGDQDGDGLPNAQELSLGTNPYQKDSDNDGVNDLVEVADETNPTDANSYNSLSKGLVAYYPFNGNANDSSGNGNSGTPVSPVLSADRLGAANAAYTFNGTSDRIDLSNSAALNMNNGVPFSMSAWIKTDFSDGQRVILAKAAGQWGNTPALFVDNEGKLQFDNFYINEVHSSATVRTGTWMHVAVTYDGSTYRLYVNGVADGERAFGGSNESGNSWTFSIGGSLNTSFPSGMFKGSIDEVQFWGRTLSPTEVAGVVQASSAPANRAPVVGSANLDSISESIAPTTNSGTAVTVLTATSSDADSAALKGIAITGIDTSHGSWEYTLDGGSVWNSLSGVSLGSARLLKSDGQHRVRFVPNENFSGNAEIRYRAWDQTSGEDGSLADLTGVGGGAWVLVAYGAQASLGGSLTAASGSFSSSARTGSAVLPGALDILKNSTELAMTWTASGGSFPSGGTGSYTHGIAFSLPNAAGMSFDGSASTPVIYYNGNSYNPLDSSFAVGSSSPDQSLVDVRTLVGSPGMPSQMYLRNKTFGAGYGGVYGLVMNDGSNAQLDYNQLPDSQTFKAVYLDHGTGDAQGQGLVMGGAGGAQNSYVPSTMAMWARLDSLQLLALSGNSPVTGSSNYLLNGIGTTYVDVIDFDASGAFSANTATGTIVVSPATVAPSVPFTYTIDNEKVTITGYTGTGGAVVIPGTIGEFPVTQIGNAAFKEKTSITAITFPDSVTTIGYEAFYHCDNLMSITFGSGLKTIGDWAFAWCGKLPTLIIPDSVTSLGEGAVSDCSALTSLTIGNQVPVIWRFTFSGDSNLTAVTLPASVGSIGEQAFSKCTKLATINFQQSVPPYVNGDAFYDIASGAKGYYPSLLEGLGWNRMGGTGSNSGNALSFNGNNQYVLAGNGTDHVLTTGTIECWIKSDVPVADTDGFHGIMVKQDSYGLFLKGNELIAFDWQNGGERHTFRFLRDEHNNAWHHVAMSFQSGVTDGTVIYLDGQPVLTTTYTVGNSGDPLAIGAGFASSSQLFQGMMDEVRVWNIVRTPAQIATYRNVSVSSTSLGLVSYFKFDESSGSSAGNAVPGGATATVYESPSWGSLSISGLAFPQYNSPPALQEIGEQSPLALNTPRTIPLSASDVETPVAELIFAASSSNQSLFPNGNLEIHGVLSSAIGGSLGSTTSGGGVFQIGVNMGGGSDMSWELVATPATGQSGEADITVTVIDGGGALASRTFHISVLDAYTTWAIANQVGGASDDPDGDGATNEQEYAAGTNPNDSASGPHQPVAFGDAFTAKLATGMTTKVTTASLISNDKYSGISGETRGVTFVSATGISTKGAAIQVKAGWLIYQPSPSAQNGTTDTITYTVSNGVKTAMGTVTVSLVTPEYVAEVAIDRVSGSQVYFSAMPGMTFEVQGASQPGTGATWTTIAGPNSGNWTSGADGRLVVTDPAAVGSGSRFYKFRWIP